MLVQSNEAWNLTMTYTSTQPTPAPGLANEMHCNKEDKHEVECRHQNGSMQVLQGGIIPMTYHPVHQGQCHQAGTAWSPQPEAVRNDQSLYTFRYKQNL